MIPKSTSMAVTALAAAAQAIRTDDGSGRAKLLELAVMTEAENDGRER